MSRMWILGFLAEDVRAPSSGSTGLGSGVRSGPPRSIISFDDFICHGFFHSPVSKAGRISELVRVHRVSRMGTRRACMPARVPGV